MLFINTGIFFAMLCIIIGMLYYFIDDFYYMYTEKSVTKIIESMNYTGDINDGVINDLKMKTGYEVFSLDVNNHIMGNDEGRNLSGAPSEIDIQALRDIAQNQGEVYFTLFRSDIARDMQMYFLREFEDGSLLVLFRNNGIIREVQNIFMTFLIGIIVVVYIVSFVAIYFITGHMVKPIINLKDAAEKIAAMDFDTPMVSAGNDEIGALVTSVNVMARNLSTNLEALNDSNQRLEMELSREKNLETMRRRFVSDVSHELKNPISVVIAYSEGLVMKIPKSLEAIEHYYNIILEEGKRMNQLVTDLLDLSSYQSGAFSMSKDRVNLEDLMTNSLERFELQLHEKQVIPEILTSNKHDVNGDRLRLDQVVTNLLGNALKYVDMGGVLKVSMQDEGEMVVMTIANSGSLIPEDELDNIWKSFYQLDTDNEGHGLGLAISKSIIEMHKGTISAYVSEGLNCFEVRLNQVLPRG